MTDYIEREDAILEIQKFGVGALDFEDYTPEQAERFVIGRLQSIPAADVAPVVHGQWIGGAQDFECGKSHECSVCGGFIDYYNGGADDYYYCPNCGAKMDGGEDDD